jgi:hypothetical protein
MNSLIVIVLLMASALAAPLLGSAVVAVLFAGFSVAIFLLLFVAGWVAQDYIDTAGARRPPSYP